MSTVRQIALRTHCLGIVACSVTVLLFLWFVTFEGWDVGDARSGDVVRPESSFSTFELICFELSRALTVPVRWFKFTNSTGIGLTALAVTLVAWGALGYFAVLSAVRILRRRLSNQHCESA
jgi:hypothetical protein